MSAGPPINHHHPHRDVTGGWLRPAVFGAMDGLVSNFSLIMGLAGAGASSSTIVLTGVAGWVAGAFSMGVGEYVSVTSQTEAAQREVEIERRSIYAHPESEIAELASRLTEGGVEHSIAVRVAEQLHQNPDIALRIHTLDEMGVDPEDLASPLLAAVSSFLAFTVGALLPVLPYLLGAQSQLPAGVFAAIGLFAGGAMVARVTTTRWWLGGLRQLAFGAVASALTYGVGSVLGT